MIGRTLGHYQVVEKLGEGGMGEVYKAHDERLDRDVAIKVLPSGTLADEQARKRFRKEALALSKLNHPNIATVHDFDTEDGVDFIVMELVEGASLAERAKTGPLPEKEISELGSQIADALEEAHERGIVHRDLKPGNIAVTPKGRVKVLDFGLAKMLRPVSDEATTEALTQEQAVAGTLPYMSPEELRGERADHRSDLYSFGVVLYEMATGRRPFEHTLSTALADAIIHEPPEPPSGHNRKVSPGLESIILKALDKDPEHRYQSAREMRVDLDRLIAPVSAAAPARKKAAGWWMWSAAGIAIIAVLVAATLLVTGRGQAPEIDSIAVLPLENLSGDPEQEYFADGMTEALISELGKLSALKIISRTSSMRYKGSEKPLPEIARELNVDGVIEGSALHFEDRVRITAQLIHAQTDTQIWGQTYERDRRDVLRLQSEVAGQIAKEVQATVTPEEQNRLSGGRRVNPEAHEAYLKGRYHWGTYTQQGLMKAIDYFELAIHEDPAFAPAYAMLSRCVRGSGGDFPLPLRMTRTAAVSESKSLIKKALEIDATLSEAHSSLGFVMLLEDWDWHGAEKEFKRAIELNRSSVDAYHGYAFHLTAMGRESESIAMMRKALELDPVSFIINTAAHWPFRNARQYDLAIEHLQDALEIQPNNPRALTFLAVSYLLKGNANQALALHQEVENMEGGSHWDLIAWRGYTYAVAGKEEGALDALKGLDVLSERTYVSPWAYALVQVGLGNKDEALAWLQKGYMERGAMMHIIKVLPEFDPLRNDPQFQDILQRMKFPE